MDTMSEIVDLAQRLSFWKVGLPEEAATPILAYQAVATPSTASPVDDIRAAAARGDLTAKTAAKAVDDAALALLLADKRNAVLADLGPALAGRAAGAIREHGDEIVEGLRVHFDKAARLLADAADVLPVGTTADVAITRGPDAVKAWSNLAQAASTLDALALLRARLGSPIGYGASGLPAVTMYIAGTTTRQQLAAAESILMGRDPRTATERGGRWRLLLDAGHELHLNTATEARTVAGADHD